MAARAAPLNLSSLGAVDRVVFDGNSVGNGGFTLDNFCSIKK